jgi:hypothetical protein
LVSASVISYDEVSVHEDAHNERNKKTKFRRFFQLFRKVGLIHPRSCHFSSICVVIKYSLFVGLWSSQHGQEGCSPKWRQNTVSLKIKKKRMITAVSKIVIATNLIHPHTLHTCYLSSPYRSLTPYVFSPQAGPIPPKSPTEGPTYQPLHGRRMTPN